MRATRFGLESRLGRQFAHEDPILMWIPTFAGDTIARFKKGPDGKAPWEREQGRKWAGESLEFGERFFMKEATARGSEAVNQERLGAETHRSEVSGPARADRCHDRYHCRRHCLWKAGRRFTRSRALGSDRLAGCQKECRGISDRRACSCRRSMLRLSQAQPRQSEEKEGGRDPGKELGRETKRPEEECERKGQQQQQQQRQMRSHQPREHEGERLERESAMLSGRISTGLARRQDAQDALMCGEEFQQSVPAMTRAAIEQRSCCWMKVHSVLRAPLTEHEFEKKPAQEEQF